MKMNVLNLKSPVYYWPMPIAYDKIIRKAKQKKLGEGPSPKLPYLAG